MTGSTPKRILIADDDADIVNIYRQVLAPENVANDLSDLEAELFGSEPDTAPAPREAEFDIKTVRQGEQAVEAVQTAMDNGTPFSVAFLDVRMPPGITGVEAARQIRAIDPKISIVFVTGYSDIPLPEIKRIVPPPERLFYLQKPIQPPDIQKMAASLCAQAR